MSGTRVTPVSKLAGILPAVISGGRPELARRPTARLLAALRGVTADPVWVVRGDDAPGYEPDGHEIVTYSRGWAGEYAAGHWIAADSYQPGAFLGAFPGREYACREAERRGCWAVLQLDDNLTQLMCFTSSGAARRVAMNHGGLALFADMLAAVTLATNSAMTGAHLGSLNPRREAKLFARAGFPYSLFLECCGPGREEYYGPAEDDIMHAHQYDTSAAAACAAVVCTLRYAKETQRQDGMRVHYADHKRAVGLQRMAPEKAKLSVISTRSNGRGDPRVFHNTRGARMRTPLVVTDRALYQRARQRTAALAAELAAEFRADITAKVAQRAAAAGTPGAG